MPSVITYSTQKILLIFFIGLHSIRRAVRKKIKSPELTRMIESSQRKKKKKKVRYSVFS